MITLGVLNYFVKQIAFQDWTFRTGDHHDGYFLQAVFVAPCAETGQPAEQRGRKWYISTHATESEIVLTALKAVLTALEHEAREQFRYKGKAPFGPHISIAALLDIADRQDRRKEVART